MDIAMAGSWLTDTWWYESNKVYTNPDEVSCYSSIRGRVGQLVPSWSHCIKADLSTHLIAAAIQLDTAIKFGYSKHVGHEREYLQVAENLWHPTSDHEHILSALDILDTRILFALCLEVPSSAGCSDEGGKGILYRLMENLCNIFDRDTTLKIVNGIGSTSSAAPTTSSSSMVKASRSSGPKRVARDQAQGESIEQNNNRVKRSKKLAARPADQRHLNFACPYRKHNPGKYGLNTSWVACALSPWQNVSRVKEHLYRNHKVPPHCQRCWLVFESAEEHHLHVTQDRSLICEVKPGQSPDGITKETVEILRSRKKSHPGQSEESRWKEIYCILFPEDDIVPSPYFEPVQDAVAQPLDLVSLSDFAAYSRRETPRLVRSILGNEPERDQSIDEARMTRLVQCFQERMMSEYISQLPAEHSTSNEIPAPSTTTANTSMASDSSRFDSPQLDQTINFSRANFINDQDSWGFTSDFQLAFPEGLDTVLSSLYTPDFFVEEHLK